MIFDLNFRNKIMKYISIVLIIFLILSCNKNEQSPIFNCDVDGIEWKPSSVSIGRNHDDDLLILQIKDDTLSLIFKIEADGVDDYDLSPNSNHKVFVNISHPPYVYPYESSYSLSNGNFTISEIKGFKKIMKGSFSLDVYNEFGDKKSFTNGKFSGYTYFD